MHIANNSTINSESINKNESKKWNPVYMFVFPILWGLWKYQYAEVERIELKISEVVGVPFLIIVIPIIITTLILIVKKLRKEQYINFIKHTTIGTFIMFLLTIGVELNTSVEQKNISIGESTKQDKVKTAELFKKACDGGDAEGCNNLGLMYDNGKGVKQNKFKAVEFYRKACEGEGTRGCFNLGIMYSIGEGVRQDKKMPRSFLVKHVMDNLKTDVKNIKY